MAYRLKRGVCPICGCDVLVYVTGKIRQHTVGCPGVRWTVSDKLCPGSGKEPS